MTPETIAELRRLLDAATPGPWEAHEDPAGAYVTAGWAHGNTDVLRSIVEWTPRPDDALLIATAVNALPALLDAADELLVCKTVARGHLEHAERRAAERDALAAKVARVRALALNQSGPGRWARDEGWAAFVPAAELLAALDEEPQP